MQNNGKIEQNYRLVGGSTSLVVQIIVGKCITFESNNKS